MGQRHQIYLRLPKIYYNPNNPNNRPETTVGIHHQWLYGRTALMLLGNFLSFVKNSDGDDKEPNRYWLNSESLGVLAACYSCMPAKGYFHGVHTDLEAECDDPRLCDNNDGITIIDLTELTPKYCFMSIHHLECAESERVKNFVPMSAEEYVTLYYPLWRQAKSENRDGTVSDDPDLKSEVLQLLSNLTHAELLTKDRVKEIFPKMFKRAKARA